MILLRGTWRSDGCTVGPPGTAVAPGQEAGASADMDQAAADRRHTVSHPHWCAVAGRCGAVRPWARSYDLFRRWQRDGTWQRIFAELQAEADAKELITWDLNVDSTVSRAHQHAAGARKRGTSRRSRPAGSASSRTITASAGRAVA